MLMNREIKSDGKNWATKQSVIWTNVKWIWTCHAFHWK
jgi:hypothetical protein